MIFKDFYPRPELADFVRLYHIRHFIFNLDEPLPYKPYPPRPEQCLIFCPRDRHTIDYVTENRLVHRPRSVLVGQQTKRVNLGCNRDFLTIIVVFNPGMLHSLTGIPLYELTHSEADAEAVFSSAMTRVNERLNSTLCYPEMIQIIEDFLMEAIRKSKKEHGKMESVCRLIFRYPGQLDLDKLADQACLSPRQFKRKFKDYIGTGPKTFMRISRCYKSYNMRFKMPNKDWLSIALDCGYHDYQHLVKDYQEFAGALPNVLFAEDSKAPEHHFGEREPGDHPEV